MHNCKSDFIEDRWILYRLVHCLLVSQAVLPEVMSRLIWFQTCSFSQGQRIFLQPIIAHILCLHPKWTSSCFLSKGCKSKLKSQGTSCFVLLKFIILSASLSTSLITLVIRIYQFTKLCRPSKYSHIFAQTSEIHLIFSLNWSENWRVRCYQVQELKMQVSPNSDLWFFHGKLRFHHWQLFLFYLKCQNDTALEKCQFFQVKMSHGTHSAYRSNKWWSCSSLMTITYCTCSCLLEVHYGYWGI